jgi:amino acid transporter
MVEAMIWLIFGLVFVASLGLSWLVSRSLGRRGWPTAGQVIVAGLLPVVIITVILWIWDKVERTQLTELERQEGHMGPLLLLLYGFPYVLLILIASVIVAIAARKRK